MVLIKYLTGLGYPEKMATAMIAAFGRPPPTITFLKAFPQAGLIDLANSIERENDGRADEAKARASAVPMKILFKVPHHKSEFAADIFDGETLQVSTTI
jgi:hypothetical protein